MTYENELDNYSVVNIDSDRDAGRSNRACIMALATAFFVFSISWGLIIMGKFYSLHSYVFDLGFVMQRLWQPYHILNYQFDASVLFTSGFQFVLSPLYFFNSLQLLLLFQLVAFSGSVFPLYGIAKMHTGKPLVSLAIAISFLLYFPSSGIIWFDVHFQAFFVPLFIFAYYFFLKGNYPVSSTLFLLSGTVRFPYMIFPLLFSLYMIFDGFLLKNRLYPSRQHKYNLLILIVSTIFLLGGIHFGAYSGGASFLTSPQTSLNSRIHYELLTLLFVLGPLLFLPLLKLKWIVMSFPFFLLGLYTGNSNYVFPTVITLQYTSMIVPIFFIGIIDTLSIRPEKNNLVIIHRERCWHSRISTSIEKLLRLPSKNSEIVAISILFIMVMSSTFYQPYGPFNNTVVPDYNFDHNVGFNLSDYNTLMTLTKLIPNNNPYVIFQNDMPEMLPRAEPQNLSFVFSTRISSNLTIGEVANNTFPLVSPHTNSLEFTKIDYLIAYTQSSQYYLRFGPEESTIYTILSLMLQSGKYGILAEDRGFIVLERNFHSQPKIYVPLELNVPFSHANPNRGVTFNNLSEVPRGSSSWVTLVPGNYTVTYYMLVSNAGKGADTVNLGIGYDFASSVSKPMASFNTTYFAATNKITALSFNITVPNQEIHCVFLISANNYFGNITVFRVALSQTSCFV